MKSKTTIIIMLISVLLFSCKQNEKDIEENKISQLIEKSNLEESIKWVVILPGLGCNGCIQEGEAFMRDNIENTQIFFLLTKIESIKILQQKIGIRLKDYPNVSVNEEELWLPTNSIYPCIVYLENGKLKSFEFQSPGNEAFEKLEAIISKDFEI